MIPDEEDDWTKDPEMQEFLEWMDQPGPWPEEHDKIFTKGGLSADKDGDFMKFQKEMEKRDNTRFIEEIYKINSFKTINKTDFDKEKVGSSVYGEITRNGVDVILDKFKEYFNKNTVFYDLGCGLGKMVLHVGLQVDVRRSIGVEYSKERYDAAVKLKKKYGQDNVEFLNMNILDLDLSLATVVYIDNTIFPMNLMEEVYNKLPKKCLLLYKQKLLFPNKRVKQNIEKDLIERTYSQKQLCWLIK